MYCKATTPIALEACRASAWYVQKTQSTVLRNRKLLRSTTCVQYSRTSQLMACQPSPPHSHLYFTPSTKAALTEGTQVPTFHPEPPGLRKSAPSVLVTPWLSPKRAGHAAFARLLLAPLGSLQRQLCVSIVCQVSLGPLFRFLFPGTATAPVVVLVCLLGLECTLRTRHPTACLNVPQAANTTSRSR